MARKVASGKVIKLGLTWSKCYKWASRAEPLLFQRGGGRDCDFFFLPSSSDYFLLSNVLRWVILDFRGMKYSTTTSRKKIRKMLCQVIIQSETRHRSDPFGLIFFFAACLADASRSTSSPVIEKALPHPHAHNVTLTSKTVIRNKQV